MTHKIDNYKDYFQKHPYLIKSIEEWTNYLKNLADIFYKDIIDGHQIKNMLYPYSEMLIQEVVLNAVVDIERVREFHPIGNPTIYKYAAYISHWWLRLKPFFPKELNISNCADIQKIYTIMTSINEIFLVRFIITTIGRGSIFINPCENYNNLSDKYSDLEGSLIYFMQYRDCNAKQLEMILKAINVCPISYVLK